MNDFYGSYFTVFFENALQIALFALEGDVANENVHKKN